MAKKKKLKGRTKPVQKKKGTQRRTLLIYYAAVIGFAFAYHIMSNQDWFIEMAKPIFAGYAQIGSSILNLFGEGTVANGVGIESPQFSLTIKEGCDAITPMIIFSMAILAFPIALRLKWPGLLLGLIALFILNIIRIISLYYVGKHFSFEVFDFMHVSIWQILFLIITIFIWLVWMRWALINKPAKTQSTQSS